MDWLCPNHQLRFGYTTALQQWLNTIMLMTLDLLFLVITGMLCWHPHQSFNIGWFLSFDSVMNISILGVLIDIIGSCWASHYPGLTTTEFSHNIQNQKRSKYFSYLVGSYTKTFIILSLKLKDFRFYVFRS